MSREGFRYEGQRLISTENLGVDANALIAADSSKRRSQSTSRKHELRLSAAISLARFPAHTLSWRVSSRSFLVRFSPQLNENEGDIRELYKMLSGPLHLNPAGEHLETYLRSILQGLKSRNCAGLYELANKAGDRHTRRYNPEMHHAKLAVNAAYTLCEFLLDSFEYQQNGKAARRLNSNR